MRPCLVALFLLSFALPTLGGTIDFESTGGTVGSPIPADGIASFGGAVLGDYGGDPEGFRSAWGNDGLSPLETGFGDHFLADPYGTGGTDFGVPVGFTVTFAKPVTNVSLYLSDMDQNFLEWVTVTITDGGSFSDSKTVTEASPGAGDGRNTFMDFANATPITSMTVTSGASSGRAGWGIDNVGFTAVPLPAASWLGLGLLALLGAARRRRRRRRG